MKKNISYVTLVFVLYVLFVAGCQGDKIDKMTKKNPCTEFVGVLSSSNSPPILGYGSGGGFVRYYIELMFTDVVFESYKISFNKDFYCYLLPTPFDSLITGSRYKVQGCFIDSCSTITWNTSRSLVVKNKPIYFIVDNFIKLDYEE